MRDDNGRDQWPRFNHFLLTSLFIATTLFSFGQNADSILNAKEAERIEKVLASDEMRGRKTFSPEIEKAADFISNEFHSIGLQTMNNSGTYLQSFSMVTPTFISLSASIDGKPIDTKTVVVVTTQAELKMDQNSGYEVRTIKAGANIFSEVIPLIQAGKNYIVFVDTSFAKTFLRLVGLKRSMFKTDKSVIFILYNGKPTSYSVESKQKVQEQPLANVVGILPGKTRKDEYVIFSGHYDHLGVGAPVNGDSIYNGANDDAAGTTAVIMLAKYFKALGNNERTIVFAAFTAEEVGGFGSQYFSQQFDPANVVAMFNIEMIGTESKWGKNSAYITGYDKTNMGTLLQKDLEGSEFKFYPDPYTQENLFYRSDNATLARQGVPAHTISTSKMDSEPNYHRVSDQVETLDLDNMAHVIRAIALSSKSIVAGTATPTRVKADDLQ